MKIYLPIAKVDAERREVWGYASTEARDDQGEIVKREALTAALGDYMKFANIREMHQLSAVGVAREATVDEKGLYVGAKIVDDQAWQKVLEGVYKGYSIGGRVTERDPGDYKTITGLVLNEISLVDRPANPEAVFDYWRAAGAIGMSETRFDPPLQIWACGVPKHRHLAKAEALRCQELAAGSGAGLIAAARTAIATAEDALGKADGEAGEQPYGDVEYADPGYQADRKKRYPIDTGAHIRAAWNFISRPTNARRYTPDELAHIKARIVAAWKAKIDKDGPPGAEDGRIGRSAASAALSKALSDVGHVARIILDLNWLKESLAVEAAMEGDGAPQPSRLQSIIAELCDFLNALVAEETAEILDDTEIAGEPSEPMAADIMTMAAGVRGAALVADLCRGSGPRMRKLATAILAKDTHSAADQALLDLAYRAVGKCLGMDGLLFAERSHLGHARDALKAAGATGEEATVETPRDPQAEPRRGLSPALLAGRGPGHDASSASLLAEAPGVLEMIATALGKSSRGHRALMDIAHDCIGRLTDNACCTAAKAGARHSKGTMGHLAAAHDHLVAAGARCDAGRLDDRAHREDAAVEESKAATADLARMLAGERAEKSALIATLSEIVPRLDGLTKRVEDIARTPLPPLAFAKSTTAVSKQQDAGVGGLSSDELAAAFSRMSQEEQTLTLIKASYARPIRPPGFAPANETRGG